MSVSSLMDAFRSFFGLKVEPPRNDFRNPIWGSDDDDDCDELYTRQQMEEYTDPLDLHKEFARQMHDMFKSFGSLFGDMRTFFNEGEFQSFGTMTDPPISNQESAEFDSNRIRDYYLKPGYHKQKFEQPKEDIDLDGEISSNEISGLLKQKVDDHSNTQSPFDGSLVPGRLFCKTIITTSITKPDGTIETRRIVKNGNEVIEETTTSGPDSRNPLNPGLAPVDASHMFSKLSSLLRNFN